MKEVTIYTIPTCKYCKSVKKLLDELKVNYKDVDVSEDLEAQREMVEKSGQVGVPVVVIGDEVVVGYDRRKLKKKFEVKREK